MPLTKLKIEELKARGYYIPERKSRYTMQLSTEGHRSTGKTELMLSMPRPSFIFNIDIGLEDMLLSKKREIQEDVFVRDIKVPNMRDKDIPLQKICDELWALMWSDMKYITQSGDFKSVGLDTGTEAWTILRMADFGKLAGVPQRDYETVNLVMGNFLRMPQENGIHFVCAHHLEEIWEEREMEKRSGEKYKTRVATGEYRLDGFKKTENIFRVAIRQISRHPSIGGREFGFQVLRCSANPSIEKIDMWERDLGVPINFKNIAMLCYPESREEDWE